MSWFIVGTGRPEALAASIREKAAAHRCAEPEETIKAKFVEIAETALAAFPPDSVVRITGQGSQSTHGCDHGKAHNSLKIEIEPLYDFVG